MTMYLFRCVLLSMHLLVQEAGQQQKDGDKDAKGGKTDGDKDAKGGKKDKQEKREETQPQKEKKEKREEKQPKKEKKEKDIENDKRVSEKAEGGASSTQDFDHMCMVVHQKQIGGMNNCSLCTRSSN